MVNQIINPSFESGTAPWSFFTNGTGAFDIVTPGVDGANAARITISSVPATNPNIQLRQYGITLKPAMKYRVSFSAYSSTSRPMDVIMLQDVSPYVNYGLLSRVAMTNAWKRFVFEFQLPAVFTATVTDARLMFWFAPYVIAGDVFYIDNVVLEEATALMFQVSQFVKHDGWGNVCLKITESATDSQGEYIVLTNGIKYYVKDATGNYFTYAGATVCSCTNWVCEPGNTGYEVNECGERRANPACVTVVCPELANTFTITKG